MKGSYFFYYFIHHEWKHRFHLPVSKSYSFSLYLGWNYSFFWLMHVTMQSTIAILHGKHPAKRWHLQQACPKGLGLTYQRHPITPTLPQTASPAQKKKQTKNLIPNRNDPKHHITWTPSRPSAHKQQSPNHHNWPPRKPQETCKWQCGHQVQACILLLWSQKFE